MGLITEHDGAAYGYEAVRLPPHPVTMTGQRAAVFRRRSARPSRRAVLYLHCLSDSFVPADLASWYTERGFHFYVAALNPQIQPGRPGGRWRHGRQLKACFAGLDSACTYLREADGIDALIVSAHGTGALAAALWCDARRATGPADALVLSNPAFGRQLRRGLDITCPVLVISAPDEAAAEEAKTDARTHARSETKAIARTGISGVARTGISGRQLRRRKGRDSRDPVWLGPHVTWLRLADGLAGGPAAGEDRRRFFDEMGRWLGAYMYGQVRDQLL
jgi:hypothetical protein